MVKPQINVEKKDDLKKPDNVLVKVVTVGEEPAPVNPEPIYGPVVTRQRKGCRLCVCLFLLLTTFVLLCGIGMMLFKRFHYGGVSGLYCGVGYYDDWESYYDYQDDTFDSSDGLIGPRPTGPPLERFLQEGIDIQVELNIVRISHPGDDSSQSITVLHDFDMSLSAYRLDDSEICYIHPLDSETSLNPENFLNLIQNGDYQEQQFPMMSKVYGVIPDEVYDLDQVSEHVQSLCEGYSTYYIQDIPTERWSDFWHTIRSVIRGRRHEETDDSSNMEEEGRPHHGGGRHHPHRGSDSHSGESHGSHSGEYRQARGIMNIRQNMENVRSFDGQQVVDMHVFNTQQLEDLSSADMEQLQSFLHPPSQ